MSLPSPIDAVLLDAGGVLVLPDPSLLLAALEGAGIPASRDPDTHAFAHFSGAAALAEFPVEHVEVWAEYNEAYVRALEVSDERVNEACAVLADVFPRLEIFSRPIPGAVDALRELHAAGVELAIVSNASGQAEDLLRQAGLCQPGGGELVPVAAVVDSHLVGVAKPDPRIFEIALEAVGVPAERAVHVGDIIGADVVGARAAGVRPLHMDPYGMCSDGGHDHVRSLDDVVALVLVSR